MAPLFVSRMLVVLVLASCLLDDKEMSVAVFMMSLWLLLLLWVWNDGCE